MPVFYIFCVCTGVQTLFSIWELWLSAPTNSDTAGNSDAPAPLSILICARNEAERLRAGLPRILEQAHPDFEVILVNDGSTDDTQTLADSWAQTYPQLRVIRVPADEPRRLPGKKHALSCALEAARHENLLLCDADCHPASAQWARIMSAPLQKGKEIVAGYGAYERRPGLLNAFIRWETLHSFILFSAAGRSGLPYMAVGRNLACKKALLLAAQAHPLWKTLPSGDDDLLIRLQATRHNYSCCADPEALTYSDAPADMNAWRAQKQRHVSTGKSYKTSAQLLLGIYALSHACMWISFILLSCSDNGYLVYSPMLLRCVLAWSVWAIAAKNMREPFLIPFFPITDFCWLLYHALLSPYIFFKNKQKWT